MTALGALLGLGVAAGLLLAVAGLVGHDAEAAPRTPRRVIRPDVVLLRAAVAVGAGLVTWVVTGLPVAGVGAAAGAAWLPSMFTGGRHRRTALALIESLATWIEMLQDSLSAGGHGLQTVLRVTAPAAPRAVRADVLQLAADCERMRFDAALAAFADRVAHPVCDQVVMGLRLHGSERLGEVLGAIAASARQEADLYRRIDTARSTERLTAQVIVAITVGTAALLTLTGGSFLAPYGTFGGELALTGVLALFAAGLMWLARISRGEPPRRLLDPRVGEGGR